MSIEYGVSVAFDGKIYTLMESGHIRDYPVGGLISEYCRLAPTDIKQVILKCSGLNRVANPDTATECLLEFHKNLFEEFPPVMASMISVEFLNAMQDWTKAMREDCIDSFISNYFTRDNDNQIQNYILKDTGYEEFGCETILQMLLSCYYSFANTYVNTKFMFTNLVNTEKNADDRVKVAELCGNLYSTMIELQHIDYRIITTAERELTPLYTIKSSLSLLLFDIAYSIQLGQNFTVCQNCKQIFVPEGRSDAIYCGYPAPQNKGKSCREIGAQVARANKEKNDIVTKEYRRAYMRHQMMVKRHPYDKEKIQKFDSLTMGMKDWRLKLAEGTATTDEFLAWINKYK